jgi:uncharacterized protein involved in outer membrane biogenesis
MRPVKILKIVLLSLLALIIVILGAAAIALYTFDINQYRGSPPR